MAHSIIMCNPKFPVNVGTVMRTAEIMGADHVVIADNHRIGSLYHATDTAKSYRRIGSIVNDLEEAIEMFPGYRVVAVEMSDTSTSLEEYEHHQNSVYVLGSEDDGIDLERYGHLIDDIVTIPSDRPWSMNVAIAHSMIEWDRKLKSNDRLSSPVNEKNLVNT